jgi:hypothetical protein
LFTTSTYACWSADPDEVDTVADGVDEDPDAQALSVNASRVTRPEMRTILLIPSKSDEFGN